MGSSTCERRCEGYSLSAEIPLQRLIVIAYVKADIAAEQGMVRTHAHRIFPATPQRTAVNRRKDPTPIIEPVIVWVVLTGIPNAEAT